MAETYEIRTERLNLRAPMQTDAQRITDLIGIKDVVWNLGRAPYPYHLSDAQSWIARCAADITAGTEYPFVIENSEDGVVGAVGLNAHPGDVWEIGYWVGKPWWGKGYITEAAQAVLDWATREKAITAFISGHYVDNPASGRVLEKLGFEPVGVLDLPGKARGMAYPAQRYTRGAPPETAMKYANHA